MDHRTHATDYPSHTSSHDDCVPSSDRTLARQRRKRTSADDQATLEAAYRRDPKPDKAARLQLVEQVALGEKEVQIWFQNRRQTWRRKSGRPLLPEEVVQYQMAKSASTPGHEAEGQAHSLFGDASTVQPSLDLDSERHLMTAVSGIVNAARQSSRSISPVQLPAQQPTLTRTVSATPSLPPGYSSHIGYLANRRSAPSLHRSFSETAMLPPAQHAREDRPIKKPRAIRLSMDSEGNATVTTKDTSSPSPPRPLQFMMPHETPSPSILSTITPSGNTRRSYNGRSRDSRSWEFWCDKDARSELGEVAEKDANGSAAGAIGLLRTASGRSVLGALSSKRNAPAPASHEPSAKRSKKRASLQRSQTSAGRLQGKPGRSHGPSKLEHMYSAAEQYKGSGYSDKENWSPGHDFDAGYESPAEDVGAEYASRPGQHSGRRRWVPSSKKVGDENDPEADPELSAFMASGRKGSRPAASADLDCVEGLLRLSQGNWQQGRETESGSVESRR